MKIRYVEKKPRARELIFQNTQDYVKFKEAYAQELTRKNPDFNVWTDWTYEKHSLNNNGMERKPNKNSGKPMSEEHYKKFMKGMNKKRNKIIKRTKDNIKELNERIKDLDYVIIKNPSGGLMIRKKW